MTESMDSKQYLEKFESILENLAFGRNDELEEAPTIPRELLKKFGDLKVFGIPIGVEYGGMGLPMEVFKDCCYRLGNRSHILGLLMGIPAITAYLIANYGNEEQLYGLLPRLCKGEVFCAFAATEAAGNWSEKISTCAIPKDNGYVLSGEKAMISWAGEADFYLVTAMLQTEGENPRPAAFLIDAKRPGLSFGPVHEKMAYPSFVNRNVKFDQVACTNKDILGRAGLGHKIAHKAYQFGRLCVSTLAVATAQAALDDAAAQVMHVRANGKRLSDLQSVQFTLAEMKVLLEAGRNLTDKAWALFNADDAEAGLHIASAKVFTARMVMDLADRALQLHGGAGYFKSTTAERRFRQARIFSLIEGSTETQLAQIASRLLHETP